VPSSSSAAVTASSSGERRQAAEAARSKPPTPSWCTASSRCLPGLAGLLALPGPGLKEPAAAASAAGAPGLPPLKTGSSAAA
jgi:hypothetical protein